MDLILLTHVSNDVQEHLNLIVFSKINFVLERMSSEFLEAFHDEVNNTGSNDLRIIICLRNSKLLLKEFQFVMSLKK